MLNEFDEQGIQKVVIIMAGLRKVGKSTILGTFLEGQTPRRVHSTMGIDIKKKLVQVTERQVHLTVYDPQGEQLFGSSLRSYFRVGQALVAVYSVSSMASFSYIKTVLDMMETETERGSAVSKPILLVGTVKNDQLREVSFQEGITRAAERDCHFFEVSLDDSQHINLVFNIAIKQAMDFQHLRLRTIEHIFEFRPHPRNTSHSCC